MLSYLLIVILRIIILKIVYRKINDLEKFIISEHRDDGSILSDIDHDLNIMFNMNDTIHTMTIVRFVLRLINTHTFSQC